MPKATPIKLNVYFQQFMGGKPLQIGSQQVSGKYGDTITMEPPKGYKIVDSNQIKVDYNTLLTPKPTITIEKI